MTIPEVLESWNESVVPKDDLEIEASDIIRKSLEKQIPKAKIYKIIKIKNYESESYLCPMCEWNVECGDEYCRKCGQSLST